MKNYHRTDSLRELNAKLLTEIAKLRKESTEIPELREKLLRFAEVEAENARLRQIIEENARRDAENAELKSRVESLTTKKEKNSYRIWSYCSICKKCQNSD